MALQMASAKSLVRLERSSGRDRLMLVCGFLVALIFVIAPVLLQLLPFKLDSSTVGFVIIGLMVIIVFPECRLVLLWILLGMMGMIYLSNVNL
jgi:hypothetical protein